MLFGHDKNLSDSLHAQHVHLGLWSLHNSTTSEASLMTSKSYYQGCEKIQGSF